jgi:hypothetical protein
LHRVLADCPGNSDSAISGISGSDAFGPLIALRARRSGSALAIGQFSTLTQFLPCAEKRGVGNWAQYPLNFCNPNSAAASESAAHDHVVGGRRSILPFAARLEVRAGTARQFRRTTVVHLAAHILQWGSLRPENMQSPVPAFGSALECRESHSAPGSPPTFTRTLRREYLTAERLPVPSIFSSLHPDGGQPYPRCPPGLREISLRCFPGR